jgi:hypothetical protein
VHSEEVLESGVGAEPCDDRVLREVPDAPLHHGGHGPRVARGRLLALRRDVDCEPRVAHRERQRPCRLPCRGKVSPLTGQLPVIARLLQLLDVPHLVGVGEAVADNMDVREHGAVGAVVVGVGPTQDADHGAVGDRVGAVVEAHSRTLGGRGGENLLLCVGVERNLGGLAGALQEEAVDDGLQQSVVGSGCGELRHARNAGGCSISSGSRRNSVAPFEGNGWSGDPLLLTFESSSASGSSTALTGTTPESSLNCKGVRMCAGCSPQLPRR